MTVEKFRGQFFPFSNMYPLPVPIRADCDIWVPSSEHAYMANRFSSLRIQRRVAQARGDKSDARSYRDALAAKRLAHRYIRDGALLAVETDEERVELMERVVYQKIERNIGVRALLLSTGNEEIYEGNEWGDRFWGVSPPGSLEGENHLGRILMKLREDFACYAVE